MTAPPGQSVADRVKAQLQGDYPAGALSWVDGISWAGPVRVPLGQVDRTAGDWSAADDKRKVAAFAKRIGAGWAKPVVAIRRPGQRLLYLVDGHTRAVACAQAGQPLTAYVGSAPAAHGGWEATHARQLAGDADAIDLSAAGYPAGTIKARSGMISLDLPKGTIRPVPGGVDDHHITIVYLGPDVDDKAFAAACQRAKAAAASAGGPLTGRIAGVDSFPAAVSDDGKVPAFAPASIPGARGIRSALEDLSASEHAQWRPHVTLAYVPEGGGLPDRVPATPVRFTHLSVHRGKDVARFPLGGTAEHANRPRPINLAGTFTEALHPRVAKGSGNAGQFGSKGTPLKAAAAPRPAALPASPVAPARAARLHAQARQDRHLARQILAKVQGLVCVRDGYQAGLLTAAGHPKAGKATKAVSAARSAAAKKAAATRKKAPKSSTKGPRKSAGSVKAGNVAKLNGQISTLRGDAKALIRSANRLDQMADGL